MENLVLNYMVLSKCAMKVKRIEMIWNGEDMDYFMEKEGYVIALDEGEEADKIF